jgi:hypothetical protein
MTSTGRKSWKELVDSKAKEIARGARNSPERKPIPWFQRGEVMALLSKALQHRADSVILDGKMFNIEYKKNNRAFVSPANGEFVPCAHLHIDKYVSDWEMEEQAHTVTRLS